MVLEPSVTEMLIVRYAGTLASEAAQGELRERAIKWNVYCCCRPQRIRCARELEPWREESGGRAASETNAPGTDRTGRLGIAVDVLRITMVPVPRDRGKLGRGRNSRSEGSGQNGRRNGDAPGIKPAITRMTAPRPAPRKSECEIHGPGSM